MGSAIASGLGMNNTYSAGPYASALSPQEGIDQYLEDLNRKADIYHGQQSLAQALQAQMAGTGPNPAQTQYMANVQNNIANAQGMIASQRGLNPALAARMGVNAAAKANQEASLGSALLQQQQQLGATANLGNLYGQMQGGNLNYLGLQNGMNQSANQLNYGVASQNAGAAQKVAGGLLQGASAGGSSALMGGGGGGAGGAGGMSGGASTIAFESRGGKIPGKPNVAGDSTANDTVPAMLSPGEIVIPRSMAHDPEKAKEFVDHLIKEQGKKKTGYGDVLKARRKKAA